MTQKTRQTLSGRSRFDLYSIRWLFLFLFLCYYPAYAYSQEIEGGASHSYISIPDGNKVFTFFYHAFGVRQIGGKECCELEQFLRADRNITDAENAIAHQLSYNAITFGELANSRNANLFIASNELTDLADSRIKTNAISGNQLLVVNLLWNDNLNLTDSENVISNSVTPIAYTLYYYDRVKVEKLFQEFGVKLEENSGIVLIDNYLASIRDFVKNPEISSTRNRNSVRRSSKLRHHSTIKSRGIFATERAFAKRMINDLLTIKESNDARKYISLISTWGPSNPPKLKPKPNEGKTNE